MEAAINFKAFGIDSKRFKAHDRPDLVMQDPVDGELLTADVAVALGSNVKKRAASKVANYSGLTKALGSSSPVSLSNAGLCVQPGGSALVVPIIFSVYGDLLDESWSMLLDSMPVGSNTALAQVVLESLKKVAANAAAFHAATSKLYREQRS